MPAPTPARSSLETWTDDPKPTSRAWQTLAEITGFITVSAFIVAVLWLV